MHFEWCRKIHICFLIFCKFTRSECLLTDVTEIRLPSPLMNKTVDNAYIKGELLVLTYTLNCLEK